MKKCSKCNEIKTLDLFYKSKGKPRSSCSKCESSAVVKSRNSAKHNMSNKKWASRHPDKIREKNLKHAYGISLADFNNILLSQKGTCALCDAVDIGPSRKDKTKREPLFVDHCHYTGDIRGLLCRSHNTALGLFEDNPISLSKAIKYLKPRGL